MKKQKIVVFALGDDFKEHENFIRENFCVIGVSDSDESKSLQYPDFIKKEELKKIIFDKILICSEKYFEDIRLDLIDTGIPSKQIMGMHGNVIFLEGRTPVIVVYLMGGMGNLMFQYALFLRLMTQCPDTDVKVDISWYQMEENAQFFKTLWIFESVFDVKFPIATKEEIAESKRQNRFMEQQVGIYQKEIENITKGFIYGYWQSAKYFNDISELVRRQYNFNLRYLSDHQRNILEQICNCDNSAAIWIRRGDYLKYSDSFGGICTEAYYQKAMSYLREKYGDVQFFVFSNDAEYVKERYKGYPCMVYPEASTEIFDYSIYMMSLCNHLIIANSTFSWWAAWLKNKEGTVICPKTWINSLFTPDIWGEHWIKI